MTLEVALALAAEMLDLFERSPEAAFPQIPAGRRADVVAVLTRVIAEVEFFEAYVGGLKAEIGRRPDAFQDRLLTYGSPEIPEDEIFPNGFAGLTAEVLADLMISPCALGAIQDVLYDDPDAPTPGPWFFEHLLHEPRDY